MSLADAAVIYICGRCGEAPEASISGLCEGCEPPEVAAQDPNPEPEPPDNWRMCHKCHGEGRVMRYGHALSISPPEEITCRHCRGRGGWLVDLDRCAGEDW